MTGERRSPDWFDRDRALRTFGFSDGDSYNRFILSGTPLVPPPMTKGELTQHRARLMAMYGFGAKDIAEALHVGECYARCLLNGSAIRNPAA